MFVSGVIAGWALTQLKWPVRKPDDDPYDDADCVLGADLAAPREPESEVLMVCPRYGKRYHSPTCSAARKTGVPDICLPKNHRRLSGSAVSSYRRGAEQHRQ